MPPFKIHYICPIVRWGCGGNGPLIVISNPLVCNLHATKNPLYLIVIWSCGGDMVEWGPPIVMTQWFQLSMATKNPLCSIPQWNCSEFMVEVVH